jgi:hypothetical protein
MRFFLAIFWGAVAYFAYPSGVSHIPLAQLTLDSIIKLGGSILAAILAILALFSNEFD